MRINTFVIGLSVLIILTGRAHAVDDEYNAYEAGFKNFITCELTRIGAVDHFKKKSFSITMINLHQIQPESGMKILIGAVQCAVQGVDHTLYAAVGVESVIGKDKVSYFTIRKKNFSILASELLRFPYKERCPWARYWVDTD